ncbi:MAG TPA: MFS transporter [Miltoncostaeaceae bacterium]|nr:MFS transporter [Miltoncostaeaceae bacterium]
MSALKPGRVVADAGDVDAEAGIRSLVDFSRREWAVLGPLATVGFFEVYDVALLTLAAPVIAKGLGVAIATFGIGVALVRLATFGSLPFMRLADRFGRRTLLLASVVLFTLATGMTALAWGFLAFVALQMAARVFLSTEQALANLVVAEELRPDRRGAGLSALGIISGLGYGAVAGLLLLVPLTPLDWRLFYIVALVPLGIAAYLRRHLPETRAYQVAQAQHRVQTTLWPRVERRHRKRLWQVITIVAAFGLVQTSGFFYASELAQTDYGWNGLFTALILAAAVFGVLGFWLGGRISDLAGRRPMLALGIVLGAAGTVLVFTQVPALFTPGFFLLATAGSCFLAASVAYMAELFPTEVRASLTAFVIVCQVAAGSLGLVLLGGLASVVSPYLLLLILGGCLTAALLVLKGLPETARRDLVRDDGLGRTAPASV